MVDIFSDSFLKSAATTMHKYYYPDHETINPQLMESYKKGIQKVFEAVPVENWLEASAEDIEKACDAYYSTGLTDWKKFSGITSPENQRIVNNYRVSLTRLLKDMHFLHQVQSIFNTP